MNHYKTSSGERVPKALIDRRVRMAKALKIQQQLNELGYNICEDMGKEGCHPDENCTRLDCSHNVSVNECQKSGRSELAWDLGNIKILGRKCHQVKDGLNLRFSNHG